MKEISINGTSRANVGKKATKEIRKAGSVPCVIYGEKKGENGLPEAIHFSVSEKEINKVIYTPNIYLVRVNIDVTSLQLGKSIKVGELSFEGLELVTPKEVIVCTVKMTRAAMGAAAAAAKA